MCLRQGERDLTQLHIVPLQGSVFRARWRGTQVAVKSICHDSKGETNLAVAREVMIGQIMGHPNLVSLHATLL